MTQPDIFDKDARWYEWLPELRVLLRSYNAVPVDERFVDTDTTPSRAMRSYLRIATYFPQRAARAAADLVEVLRAGLTDPEVMSRLATMCPITAPPGRTPDDCLGTMIPHLVAFTEAGEHADPATPDSTWEWRERLPNLSELLLGYFHQDADDPHHEVVDRYARTEHPHQVAASLPELAELRALCATDHGATDDGATDGCAGSDDNDDDALTAAVVALGSEQLPVGGAPCGPWLDDLGLRLALHLDVLGYERPDGPDPAYAQHDRRSSPSGAGALT